MTEQTRQLSRLASIYALLGMDFSPRMPRFYKERKPLVVKGPYVKNPRVAEDINKRFDLWNNARITRQAVPNV